MEELVGLVSTCRRELLWGWWPIGLIVNFMIFTASVWNILDTSSYATYKLVSKKFNNVTASAFQFYKQTLYNLSILRFINHVHLCTVLIWHIRHGHTEHELAFPRNPPFTSWKFLLCAIHRM
jgi:hypothetical protein